MVPIFGFLLCAGLAAFTVSRRRYGFATWFALCAVQAAIMIGAAA
jgi:hypothetical protein